MTSYIKGIYSYVRPVIMKDMNWDLKCDCRKGDLMGLNGGRKLCERFINHVFCIGKNDNLLCTRVCMETRWIFIIRVCEDVESTESCVDYAVWS